MQSKFLLAHVQRILKSAVVTGFGIGIAVCAAPTFGQSTLPPPPSGGSFSSRPLPPSTFQGSSQGANSGSLIQSPAENSGTQFQGSPYLPTRSGASASGGPTAPPQGSTLRPGAGGSAPAGSVPPSTRPSFNSLQPGTNSPVTTGAPSSTDVRASQVGSRGRFGSQEPGITSDQESGNIHRIENCKVELIADIEIPAKSTGPLSLVNVEINDEVDVNQQVAQIDDREAQRILEQAQIQYEIARTQSEDGTAIRIAENRLKLASTEYKVNYDLYLKRSKTKQEALRAQFSKKTSELELIQAQNDLEIARQTASAEQVNFRAAQDTVDRHKIISPIGGVVLEKFRETGEWVNRGDPVLRIARLDKLFVRGVVSTGTFAPSVFENKKVTVTAMLGGEEIEFEGRVLRTDLVTQGDNEYGIVVEVANQRGAGGHWQLLPGSFVKGRIFLNQNASSSALNNVRPLIDR